MKKAWAGFILLQITIFIFSFTGICSKMASRQEILTLPFFFFYGLMLFILFIYAILWQQVLKNVPIILATACRGMGIIYGILWGYLFFDEPLSWNKFLGAMLVFIGVYFYIFEEIAAIKKKRDSEKEVEMHD